MRKISKKALLFFLVSRCFKINFQTWWHWLMEVTQACCNLSSVMKIFRFVRLLLWSTLIYKLIIQAIFLLSFIDLFKDFYINFIWWSVPLASPPTSTPPKKQSKIKLLMLDKLRKIVSDCFIQRILSLFTTSLSFSEKFTSSSIIHQCIISHA